MCRQSHQRWRFMVNSRNGVAARRRWCERASSMNWMLQSIYIKVHHNLDGDVPKWHPNFTFKENQAATRCDAASRALRRPCIAWDGDFDRCSSMKKVSGLRLLYRRSANWSLYFSDLNATVLHDMRMTWNTIKIAEKLVFTYYKSRAAARLIKEKMRELNASTVERWANIITSRLWVPRPGMIPFTLSLNWSARLNNLFINLSNEAWKKDSPLLRFNRK